MHFVKLFFKLMKICFAWQTKPFILSMRNGFYSALFIVFQIQNAVLTFTVCINVRYIFLAHAIKALKINFSFFLSSLSFFSRQKLSVVTYEICIPSILGICHFAIFPLPQKNSFSKKKTYCMPGTNCISSFLQLLRINEL